MTARPTGYAWVMSSPKTLIKRKAAKAVVTHTAHGAVSKVRRKPARSATLLGAGALLGALAGYVLGRRTAPQLQAPAQPQASPVRDASAPAAGPAVTPVGAAAG